MRASPRAAENPRAVSQASREFALSIATAARMTPPLMTCCQKGDTSSSTRPLLSTPMIRQPSTVPQTEPRSPLSDDGAHVKAPTREAVSRQGGKSASEVASMSCSG